MVLPLESSHGSMLRNKKMILIHPFSSSFMMIILLFSIIFLFSSSLYVQPILSSSSSIIPSTTSYNHPIITSTSSININNNHDEILSSQMPSNLFINYIASPQTGQSKSNSTLTFNAVPIAIGDKTDITCLQCTLYTPVIYLMINEHGISFQYQFINNNQCPSDFIKNFNQDNYSDPDAYLADKVAYSPQYTITDLVNVTLTEETYTIYGVLYRNDERMNSGVNCVNIKYSSSGSGNTIDTIALNMASNGSCPPISSSPSCKLSSNSLFILEQFVYIRRKQ